ncbi:transcriptional regulator LysR family [Komagataeibacter medellinensis NBRC 3288]|uniref:Transcriptional regulator LysR family n=1 Tax=Komagataeibacter medellinensis (strain NBRC 3288 / BCRC 11682 / LMG 1693 / Kondo 51) TaxID=634177 RepID=G2I257_KOMMN|nr:transcriptional regulator LysR family [Komagataeibacter medellinensis NBRC 3288]
MGYHRIVSVVVPGFPDAPEIVRHSDLVTHVPRSCLANLSSDAVEISRLRLFQLPVNTPEIAISAMWHPKLDADPAHRWLRDIVHAVYREVFSC